VSANDNDAAGELLIREVDEDLRNEQYRRLWRLYGKYAITGVVAIILGVAVGQAWQSWRASQRDTASRVFATAESQIEASKPEEALKTLAPLEYPPLQFAGQAGFAVAARMRHAALLGQQGDTQGAVTAYESMIASNLPPLYRDLALLKLALLTVDSADPSALQARVSRLTVAGSPWRATAIEIMALLARRKGDFEGAAKFYKQLADDVGTPQTIRSRATEMLAVTTSPPSLDQPKG
jgi:hypothetical protein